MKQTLKTDDRKNRVYGVIGMVALFLIIYQWSPQNKCQTKISSAMAMPSCCFPRISIKKLYT